LNFNPTTNELVDALGQAYYTLDISRNLWVPIIPADIAAKFTEVVTPVMDNLGNWYIKDVNDVLVYQWNQGILSWQPVATSEGTK
jgi:hypothetical protein